MRRTTAPTVVIAAAIVAAMLPVSPAQARFAGCNRHANFNGDGYHDLVVGAYFEDLGKKRDAGAVNILYGAKRGITSSRDQFISQDTPGVRGSAEAGDAFGEKIEIGDFDGNGYTDLVIGVPREDSRQEDAGIVHVLYGTRYGLSTRGDDVWTQDTSGVLGKEERGDTFGYSLAAGDFNRDGYSDLAIGVPGQDVPLSQNFAVAGRAGAVNVLYGSRSGLTATRDQYWTQQTKGVAGIASYGDRFGWSLGSGDFDGDGYCDLAVGSPGEDSGASGASCQQNADAGICDHGAVNILFGSRRGLTSSGNQYFTQNSSGVLDQIEDDDQFGTTLAVGNFDDDSYDDLAVGVPYEDIDDGLFIADNAGAVNVLYGGRSGLSASADDFWHQNATDGTTEIRDVAQDGDVFGLSMVAGDFNADGNDDLAVGAPQEDIERGLLEGPTLEAAGGVHVIYGSSSGLRVAGNQFFTQDSEGIQDQAETGDNFGLALAAGRFDYGTSYDLAIGVPTEKIGNYFDAGAVALLYGHRPGGVSASDQLWTQNSSGVIDTLEGDDWFGYALGG